MRPTVIYKAWKDQPMSGLGNDVLTNSNTVLTGTYC
jgi:hypothetical protein